MSETNIKRTGSKSSNTVSVGRDVTAADAEKYLENMSGLISFLQAGVMKSYLRDVDGAFFRMAIERIHQLVESIPATAETDGQFDDAIVSLHYFYGAWDWYVIELDKESREAYGLVIGFESECGYFPISEIIREGAELDLHFQPCSLGEIKKMRGA